MKTKALYAGSFDPVHFGHIDIMRRAAQAFDLTVLVAKNPGKKYLLSTEERVRLVQRSVQGQGIQVVPQLNDSMLTADFAFENNIPVIVRGVRSFSDYDTEAMIRDVNISQQNGIETYFLKADQKLSHISSGAVKELFNHAGFIHEYVPLWVKREMEKKSGLTVLGVTGNIASGKSWFCEKLSNTITSCYNLDLDKLAHFILFKSDLPAHMEVRRKIRESFTLHDSVHREVLTAPLSIEERMSLGNLVFADAGLREKLNAIMYQPLMTVIRRSLFDKKGLVLVNAALLAEFKLTHICNNQVVLIKTDTATRHDRLIKRGLTEDQINNRLNSQYNDERKKYHIEQAIKRDHYGKLVTLDNSGGGLGHGSDLHKQLVAEFNIPV